MPAILHPIVEPSDLENMLSSLVKYLTMMMPQLHGKLKANGFFIYAACDDIYFDEFAHSIINSVTANTSLHLHLHLFNPRDDQLYLLESKEQVSFSYEYVNLNNFHAAASKWNSPPASTIEHSRYLSTIGAMQRGGDNSIQDRMRKTYYACARFIRLYQLFEKTLPFLAIDIDAVVRKNIPLLPSTHDLYFHRITGPKARFLAGGLYCNNTTSSLKFLNEYSTVLEKNIRNDYLFWGLDQFVLEDIVPKYNWGNLPLEYIDWFMKPESYIWTAKGQRKELEIFKTEQQKYIA
jgi:hypothetical protein